MIRGMKLHLVDAPPGAIKGYQLGDKPVGVPARFLIAGLAQFLAQRGGVIGPPALALDPLAQYRVIKPQIALIQGGWLVEDFVGFKNGSGSERGH